MTGSSLIRYFMKKPEKCHNQQTNNNKITKRNKAKFLSAVFRIL